MLQKALRCLSLFLQLFSPYFSLRVTRPYRHLALRLALCFSLSCGAALTGGIVFFTRASAAPALAAAPVSEPALPSVSNVGAIQPAKVTPLSRWRIKQGSPRDIHQVKPSDLINKNNQRTATAADMQPLGGISYYLPVGLGERKNYTFTDRTINDHMGFKVNVANGNLVFRSNDFNIRGTGLDLALSSYYNSQEIYSTEIGQNWTFGNATGLFVIYNEDGSTIFHGPSDAWYLFPSNGSGGYKTLPELNATLVKNADLTHTLTFNKTGEKLSFDYNGFLSVDQDKNGNKLTYTYNSPGSIASITDSQGRVVTFTHNSMGKVTSIKDSTNRTVSYAYDADENLLSITDVNNKKTTFTYQHAPNGSFQVKADLVKIVDPENRITTIGYDDVSRVTSITDQVNKTTTFTYTSTTTVVKDANNQSTTYTLDTANKNRIASTKDARGNTRSSSYDSFDNVIQSQDALTNKSSFVFNTTTNNLTSVTDSTGVATTFGYTNSSFPYYATNQTDSNGIQSAYSYDTKGNVSKVQSGGNGQPVTYASTTDYTYNGNGTVATQKDGNSNTTSYGYDSKGNLTSITFPAPLGKTTLTYDALSRVRTVTDGNNKTTTYDYDVFDRILKVTYADASTLVYTYDNDGNTKTVVDATGTTSFTYDNANRVTVKTLPGSKTITSTYDPVGNLATLTDAGGTVTYHYNQVNFSDWLKEPDGKQTTFGYNANDQKTSVAYPNGVTMTMGYDNAGRQTSIVAKNSASAVLSSFTYSYTNPATGKVDGRRASVTDKDGTVTKYGYDRLNQLTTAKVYNSGGTQTGDYAYTYDANGNRLTAKSALNGPVTSYTYNAASQLTTSVLNGTTTTYSYDGNGNLTGSNAGLSISYNAKNQSTSISGTSFSYSGPDQATRVQAGSTSAIYSQLGLSSETTSSGTTYYTRCSCGALHSQRTSGGTSYYLFDGLGSVVGLTDSSGAVVATYAYDPYGKQISTTGTVSTPWRYAGGYYDQQTGYYKFGIRYYDPNLGRWTQRTPVGGSLAETVKSNPYAYASNNPVNFVDPGGDKTCIPHALALAATLLAIVAAAAGLAALFVSTSAIVLTIGAFALTAGQALGIIAFVAAVESAIDAYLDAIAPNGGLVCF